MMFNIGDDVIKLSNGEIYTVSHAHTNSDGTQTIMLGLGSDFYSSSELKLFESVSSKDNRRRTQINKNLVDHFKDKKDIFSKSLEDRLTKDEKEAFKFLYTTMIEDGSSTKAYRNVLNNIFGKQFFN